MFDRFHHSLLIIKREQVIGGICFRPFKEQGFIEIAFCAITSSEQVKGYGSFLMTHLKEHNRKTGIYHFLTFADNFAIEYFQKQGFTHDIVLPREKWKGFIQEYDGGTLMECVVHPSVTYLDIPGMVNAQRDVLNRKIRTISTSHVIHPGLKCFQQGERHSWPFQGPVSEAEAPNYYAVVKDPVDIQKVGERLATGSYYITKYMFQADLKRMCENCRVYNGEGSDYSIIANRLEQFVAYKKLAFTYHPDKQLNEDLKVKSQQKFALISMAKETLTDEKQRAIYDQFGINGLNNSQAIINKYEEVDKLLRAFGQIQQNVKEERVLDYFNGQGYQAVTIAYHPEYNKFWIDKFDSSQTFKINSEYGRFDITPAFTKKRYDTTFSCKMGYTKSLTAGLQFFSALNYTESYPLFVNTGIKTVIRNNVLCQVSTSLLHGYYPLEGTVTLAKQLTPTMEGKFTSSVTIMKDITAAIDITNTVENRVFDFHIATANFGAFNTSFTGFTTSISRRLSAMLEVHLSLKVSQSKYLYVLGIHHKYQSIDIPLPIYAEISPMASLVFFTVPSVVLTCIKLFILNPIMRRKEQKALQEKKDKHASTAKESRARADVDVQLMKPTVEKKKAVEKAKNGLIIQDAVYGVLNEKPNASSGPDDFPPTIDVTVPLQYLVEDSKLELHPNKMSDLLGFCDPRVGEAKQLKVVYFFQGKLHQTIASDNDHLRIPLRY
eukprot:gene427-508_t